MIKQFINKLLGKSTKKADSSPETPAKASQSAPKLAIKTFGKRHEVPVSMHGIDPQFVDRRAIEVVKTLQDRGYEAYIVGGAVRDLLLGLKPKDFDVATNATPEQVKSLFRRAFIIGRRFRIVHVVFGRGRENEVIEVTTFRAFLDNQAAEKISGNEKTSRQALAGVQHAVDASGRVLRDNVWGSMQEDAARRDFSINAMYYDPRSQIVVDYHHGIEDAHKLMIRMIGDPVERYREDPVRMLRAIRFAAKLNHLGFKLGTKTAQPLMQLRGLLEDIPPSRMFDEMLKLLQTGHALASVEQLKFLQLDKGIYPLLDVVVERADWPLVKLALQDTDRRVAEGKSVAPSFLLACVLWDDVQRVWEQEQARGEHASPALSHAISEVFERRVGDVSGRGKLAADMREIWMLQPRFERRTGKAPLGMVEQPRFRAGLDFLRLRGRSGETIEELAQWWETFSLAQDDKREQMLEDIRTQAQQSCKTSPARKTRKPRKPKASNGAGSDAGLTAQSHVDVADAALRELNTPALTPAQARAQAAGEPEHGAADDLEAGAAPAKKRRRRRKKTPESGNDSAAEPSGDSADQLRSSEL